MSSEPTNTDSTTATDPGSQVRLPDGRLMPIRDAPVGGQAVLEGVMMRGVSHWAVAVREPADRNGATPPSEISPNGASINGPSPNGAAAIELVEKAIRISIFLAYIWAISRIRDLRRVFEYHGAEHKTISCYEAGDELVPERATLYSRLHMRCGTSFLLIVMIIAVFVFAPIGRPALQWLILSRILGIGLVAGLAYEVIRWAGRNRRKRWVRGLMWPGLQLQKLTTREPSLDQLAVSIAALEAVLARENPAESSAEDRLGMEVVA